MDLISANGGLYIKLGNPPAAQTQSYCSTEDSPQIGQALAMQAAVLPPVYGEAFSTLFDEAPQMSYEEVEKVFKRDFDKLPGEMFDVFERDAKASASIASVFKARLKSGEWVAVKVQKPEIEKQVEVYPTSLFCSELTYDSGIYLHIGTHIRRRTAKLVVKNANVCLRSMVI
jgi:hypothetical protein